ncbi:MAG TPA: lysophospholipase [Candidatus Omnitrophota bacterium]|nr:lysophospholipase [Candidatus Omnitrophota bacterium]
MTAASFASMSYRQWDGAGENAVLLLVHGLGGHTGRWEPLAVFCAQRGISSYALALRGFGDAPGIPGHIDSFGTYLSDIEALAGVIRDRHPHHKIYLLGESLGGLICFLAAARIPGLCSGLICLSPAFKSTLKIGSAARAGILFSAFFSPERQFTMPFSLTCCSRDESLVERFEKDTREHRFASARLLFETRLGQATARRLRGKITVPVLFLVSGRDTMVSTEESVRIFKALNVKDKTINVYPDMYHALSIDLGREKVFEDIIGWVNAHSLKGAEA